VLGRCEANREVIRSVRGPNRARRFSQCGGSGALVRALRAGDGRTHAARRRRRRGTCRLPRHRLKLSEGGTKSASVAAKDRRWRVDRERTDREVTQGSSPEIESPEPPRRRRGLPQGLLGDARARQVEALPRRNGQTRRVAGLPAFGRHWGKFEGNSGVPSRCHQLRRFEGVTDAPPMLDEQSRTCWWILGPKVSRVSPWGNGARNSFWFGGRPAPRDVVAGTSEPPARSRASSRPQGERCSFFFFASLYPAREQQL